MPNLNVLPVEILVRFLFIMSHSGNTSNLGIFSDIINLYSVPDRTFIERKLYSPRLLKIYGSNKNFSGSKIFGQKDFWVKKILGPKTIRVTKFLGPKKVLGPNKFLGKK